MVNGQTYGPNAEGVLTLSEGVSLYTKLHQGGTMS